MAWLPPSDPETGGWQEGTLSCRCHSVEVCLPCMLVSPAWQMIIIDDWGLFSKVQLFVLMTFFRGKLQKKKEKSFCFCSRWILTSSYSLAYEVIATVGDSGLDMGTADAEIRVLSAGHHVLSFLASGRCENRASQSLPNDKNSTFLILPSCFIPLHFLLTSSNIKWHVANRWAGIAQW